MIGSDAPPKGQLTFTDFKHSVPFLFVHFCCLFVFVVGVSPIALIICLVSYLLRMFGITAGYHRYFSHRTYKTSRWFQFVLAVLGASAAQMGPLWWAEHHRRHHAKSDTEDDIHSPSMWGLWWSHVGWIMSKEHAEVTYDHVEDLKQFPELKVIDRHYHVVPIIYASLMYALGAWLGLAYPQLGVSGWQLLIWGFFVSTVMTYHATFAINSVAHWFGTKRYQTGDESRNSFLLALFTLGEGWHNNHHRFPSSERQGFFWWEIDFTHYVLKLLNLFGFVWDLRKPPKHAFGEVS